MLRHKMSSHGYSMRRLAKKLGYTHSFLHDILGGLREPNARFIAISCSKMGLNFNDLYEFIPAVKIMGDERMPYKMRGQLEKIPAKIYEKIVAQQKPNMV